MRFIKNFNHIARRDVAAAGGKGASLGEMTRAGMLVPPGFVITASAFDGFLHSTGLDAEIEAILRKLNHKDLNSVEKASVQIRAMIDEEAIPPDLKQEVLASHRKLKAKFVAVRSSATAEDSKVASWAGELETYLNVTEAKLALHIIKCWSSLFTPRAIFYRYEKKLHRQPVSVAVVVQKMVQSEVSGICFTVHPVTEDRNQMVIEAGLGLGEAIVSGQITPDTYIVHKKDFSILDINVSEQKVYLKQDRAGGTIRANWRIANKGSKQKLTEKQIVELARVCKKIEQHYRHPQDIEWAYAKGKFYIVQSRPITTLKH